MSEAHFPANLIQAASGRYGMCVNTTELDDDKCQ